MQLESLYLPNKPNTNLYFVYYNLLEICSAQHNKHGAEDLLNVYVLFQKNIHLLIV